MSNSMEIIEILVDYNFNLTKDDIINLKLVMKIIDSKKKLNTFNSICNDNNFCEKNNMNFIKKIDSKIKEISSMIDNCLETEIEKLDILIMYKNELISLKEEFYNEFKVLFESIDKTKEEKRLVDSCIKSIFNGKSNKFKKKPDSKDKLLGEKYEIDINLLDNISLFLEDKNLINEIKVNLPIKKQLDELKEKLSLYKLIIDNKNIINLYKEKKKNSSLLNSNIKMIKQKLEIAKQNKKSLSGKIVNLFSNKDNKLSTLEKNLEENQKALENINQDLNEILENIFDIRLKNILTNINFYINEINIDEHSIGDIIKKISKLSEIKCSQDTKQLINDNPDLCEILLILSEKKQKQNTTPIISFHILNVLKNFYQLDLIIDKDNTVEKLINEINTKYEIKLQKFSNIEVFIEQKLKNKKYYLKHST